MCNRGCSSAQHRELCTRVPGHLSAALEPQPPSSGKNAILTAQLGKMSKTVVAIIIKVTSLNWPGPNY